MHDRSSVSDVEARQQELVAIGALNRRQQFALGRSLSDSDLDVSIPISATTPRHQSSCQQLLFPLEITIKELLPSSLLQQPRKIRKTKIVCAIGPSCSSVEKIGQLIDEGMGVARLNFSHGDHSIHASNLKNLRLAARSRPSSHVAVLMDTKGPEIRTGMLQNHEPVELQAGQLLEITTDYDLLGTSSCISCSYEHLPDSVKEGGVILVSDGEIVLTVIKCMEKSVLTKVMNHCILEERKNMNLPGATIRIPGITEKDIYDITEFGLKYGVDIISGSFVRTAKNVRAIRDCLGVRGRRIRVHAKIESIEALRNIDEIISEADGIHVSRGDLGMELEPQQVFLAQKMIIYKANMAGKPVVTSTQMLQSMTLKATPTFAECSDVANAVLDGTDAVMLSSETAKGLYPIESVRMMSKICIEAESCLDYKELYSATTEGALKPISVVEAVASSAVETAIDVGAKLIICFSETGYSAKLVAKYRPKAKIMVVTASDGVSRQMGGLSRGVTALLVGSMIGTDSLLARAITYAKECQWIMDGEIVIAIHGDSEAKAGKTNIVRIIQSTPAGFTSPTTSDKPPSCVGKKCEKNNDASIKE